jgi:mannan endo-1,4-beta-mannosidase
MLKSIFSLHSLIFISLFFFSTKLFAQNPPAFTQDFIKIKHNTFQKNGKAYFFLGTNFWYGMNLGIDDQSDYRKRLIRELDRLQDLGINNLRIMAASEGPDDSPWRMLPALQPQPATYNEALLKGLDFLLVEMKKRNMYGVLCLNNMWPWSGGFAQYINWVTKDPIPYPPPAEDGKWLTYMKYSTRFFKNEAAQQLYFQHLSTIINRVNSISKVAYKEDATIMSWQLANEPRPILNNRAYRKWIKKSAAFIKKLDPYHLVSIGSEGNAFLPLSRKFKKEHQVSNIDYATMHIWIQNWGWYDPKKPEKTFQKSLKKAKKYIQKHISIAQKLNMPLVLEEFGIARDFESYEVESPTRYRDLYYQEIFSTIYKNAQQQHLVAGSNFWAWAGEGRPRQPKAVWKTGDDFIGDPPFEYQGWYSIYDRDASTLEIIRTFAKKMNELE